MRITSRPPSPAMIKAREAMISALREFGDELSAPDMLAIAAYTVGQLIALQDQRTMTPEAAMAVVTQNVEAGNRHVIEGLAAGAGSIPHG